MTGTATAQQHPRSRSTSLAFAGAAGLALVVGVGLGTLQVHHHDSRVASQVQQLGGSQASSLAATGSRAAVQPWYVAETGGYSTPATSSVPAAAGTPHLYLVASGDEAAFLRGALATPTGELPPQDSVRQVAGEAEAATTAQAIADENTTRASLGLPEIAVVDLRPSGAETPLIIPPDQGYAGALGAAGMPGQVAAVSALPAFADVPLGTSVRVYLVGTQAEAVAIRNGPPALARSVLVVRDASDEAQAQETIARQNSLRALVGLAPMTVVDLRSSDTTSGGPALARQAIADVNRLRVSLGLPELDSPPADQAARQAIADENQLRVSLGLPELPATQ
jgi:hypothetical protein